MKKEGGGGFIFREFQPMTFTFDDKTFAPDNSSLSSDQDTNRFFM